MMLKNKLLIIFKKDLSSNVGNLAFLKLFWWCFGSELKENLVGIGDSTFKTLIKIFDNIFAIWGN